MSHTYINHDTEINWRFGIAIAINIVFVAAEVVFGLFSDSLALLADAGHNASDILGLGLAMGANLLRQKQADKKHTYGWRYTTILAALMNALILMIVVAVIVREAVERFGQPGEIGSLTVIWVAAIGTVVNLGTALVFRSGRQRDLNVWGAYIHMAADAGVSAGVVLSGVVLQFTDWVWVDPAISLIIAAVIFWSTWNLLRDAFHLAVGGVPREIDLTRVSEYLSGLPGVNEVHDLHVWGVSTTESALTAHLVLSEPVDQDSLIDEAAGELASRFEISHSTLQIEREKQERCEDQL